MKLRFFFLLCFCVCVLPGKAQNDYPRHAVYAESGSGYLYVSVNYEYHVVVSNRESMSFRAGLSSWQFHQPGAYLFLPFELLLVSGRRFAFECGPGLTLSYGHRSYSRMSGGRGVGNHTTTYHYDTEALPQFRLGFRYQSLPKGITARLGVLVIGSSKQFTRYSFPLWPSAAIGYAF